MKTIRLDRDGRLLRTTIDRADDPRNAVDGQLHEDLTEPFGVLRRETDARAVVLIGTGSALAIRYTKQAVNALVKQAMAAWHERRTPNVEGR